MGQKTIIIIHGRSTKPSASAHQKLIRAALVNGLSRVDISSARKVASGEIKLAFAYYGDINNRLMLEDDPEIITDLMASNDEAYGMAPCRAAGPLARGIDRLATIKAHDKSAYKALLRQFDDNRWYDEVASAVSGMASVTGLSEYVVKWATADMSQYLMTRQAGSEIRQRLQGHLKPALEAGSDICLISHSMGCIVSYDVLWKYSRMSEYRDLQTLGSKVSLWLTLGCPLGEPGVRDNLYDASERGGDRYPRHMVKSWVNMAAADDFVSHDGTMANDFKDMLNFGYVDNITDHEVYNFWAAKDELNPHNFYGYLDNPMVASQISGWVSSGAADSVDQPLRERVPAVA